MAEIGLVLCSIPSAAVAKSQPVHVGRHLVSVSKHKIERGVDAENEHKMVLLPSLSIYVMFFF